MSELLVLGNGFDLTLGAKTSYDDYFNSNYYSEIKNKTFEFIFDIEDSVRYSSNSISFNICDINFNCWDLLFCLESKYNSAFQDLSSIKWCDIEKVIHDSLVDSVSKENFWDKVLSRLHRYTADHSRQIDYSNIYSTEQKIKVKAMCMYFISKDKSFYNSNTDFYDNLLLELKDFEHRFGLYIERETKENDDYLYRAQSMVLRLANNHNSVLVDNFNYSDFSSGIITIRHINGDVLDPIFGIEISNEESRNNHSINSFSKTSRRLHQDANYQNKDTKWNMPKIDKAIIYGHSLNLMDYDYFRYLFALLKFNTFEIEKMGSIEFVYKIYDRKKEKDIIKTYTDSVYALFNLYEENIRSTNRQDLINLLRFSGKLKITRI